jgi:ketosteroid isomerase-like protein
MLSNLPQPVRAYIAASNSFDIAALMATFAKDALVNDHRDEFEGQDAIRNWAQREIVDDRVTMRVTAATHRGHSAAVTAIIDGNFDKTSLPDPLVLTFYFSVSDNRIDQLIIVHNKPAS